MTESVPVPAGYLMETLLDRTVSFLREEIGLEARVCGYRLDDVQALELRYLTSIISASGSVGMHLAFTFDEPLIRRIFEVYCRDIEVAEEDREEYLGETAGDIVNVIVGNSTARLAARGPVIALSPPIVISEARSVIRRKEARFYTADLETAHGYLSLYCIGPRQLFDPTLNYIGGARP